MTSWATPDQAARHWPDAATLDPARLVELLDAAAEQCAAYAPTPTPTTIPTRYVLATIYQAREIAAAATRDGDLVGAGELAFRSRPLTATVKQLLRPETRGVLG